VKRVFIFSRSASPVEIGVDQERSAFQATSRVSSESRPPERATPIERKAPIFR
jgi:hypothetical protein